MAYELFILQQKKSFLEDDKFVRANSIETSLNCLCISQ